MPHYETLDFDPKRRKRHKRRMKTYVSPPLGPNLGRYDEHDLNRLMKSLDLSSLPFPVYIECGWTHDAKGRPELYIHTRLFVRDRENPRRMTHLGSAFGYERFRVPPGRQGRKVVSKTFILNVIRRQVMEAISHEVDEFFMVDGERYFDPHTRKGRARAW